MRRARERVLAAALAGGLALAGAWALVRERAAQSVALTDNAEDVEWLERLRARERGGEVSAVRAFPDSTLVREIIPEELVARLFPSYGVGAVYDAQTYYRHAPLRADRQRLREHPRGEWILRTNSLGLRDDDEPRAERPDLRVLVTGDSHTDGVCANDESFAQRLELGLAAARPGEVVEVQNAGRGGYTFYNYLGVLEKHLALAPDALVVAFYAGNDFQEALTYRHYFERTPRPAGWQARRPDVLALARDHPAAVAQGFAQIAYFAFNPSEVPLASDTARAVCAEIVRLCAARGVLPVFVHLPAPVDLEWSVHAASFEPCAERLGLAPEQLAISARLAAELVADLRARGVAVLDGAELLADGAEPYYWRADQHLDLAGHARVAAALVELLAARLGADERR